VVKWSKLAVNKWLKQQANLIMDEDLAHEALTLTTQRSERGRRADGWKNASPTI
jgi:hypothetical protein